MSEQHGGSDYTAIVRRMTTHTIKQGRFAGRTVELWALSIQDLAACQDETLASAKRAYLQTYTRNADLMPDQLRDGMIRQAFETAAKMTYQSLPPYVMEVPTLVTDPETGATEQKLVSQKMEPMLGWMGSTMYGRLYSVWLSLRRAESQRAITLSDVDQMFVESPQDLRDVADKIGDISQPRVGLGNDDGPAGEPAPAAARETPRQRRERKRRERFLKTGP